MQWLFLIVAFSVGLILPLQPGINAQLRTHLGSPFTAAFISFVVGTLITFVVSVIAGRPSLTTMTNLGDVPWWAWTGGAIGATFVTISVILAPRLGATLLVGAVVCGQLLGSMLIDHYGLVGFPVNPVNWGRVAGVVLLMAGVVVVQASTVRP